MENVDVQRLAVSAEVSPDTIRRWLAGRNVTAWNRRRIEAAAKELNLEDAKPAGQTHPHRD